MQLNEHTPTKLKYVARTSNDYDTIKSLFDGNEEQRREYSTTFWENYKIWRFNNDRETIRYSKIQKLLEQWEEE